MKKFFILTATLLFFFSLKTTVHAYILEKNYSRVYEVNDDYALVHESKNLNVISSDYYIPSGSLEGFTIFNPIQNDPQQATKLQQTLDSIQLTDNYGNNLSYTSETTGNGNLNIRITISSGIYYSQPYTINLTYKSYGLVIKSGAIRDVYIPAFSKDYVFEDAQSKETVSTEIRISDTFGNINFTLPQTNVNRQDNNWVINYNQQDLVGKTGWIQVGTKQFYSFKINQPYSSSTEIPIVFNTYKIVLPRDVTQTIITQKVYFSKIDPLPYTIEQDENGNNIATFKVPANKNGNIVIEGYAELNQNDSINLKGAGTVADIPKDVIDKNTSAEKYWEVDAQQIQDTAKQIKGDETDVYKLVEKTYQFVVQKINYDEVKKFGLNQRQGALVTLENGSGVCMEYSDLFITLMRAEGIPARAAFGTGYSALDFDTSSSDAVNHQWAEVYLPSVQSWVEIDTTWGEGGRELIGGDLNHFYSHVASAGPETPSSTEVIYFGKSAEFQERDMKVSAISRNP